MEYAVNLATGVVIATDATAQNPGVPASVKTFQILVSGGSVVYCALQHLGALS